METHSLIPHPAFPPLAVSNITARVISIADGWLQLRWRIEGGGKLVIPPFAGKGRTDGLWQTTCFELFVRDGSAAGYCEFNLSPSERWAAYDFQAHREGMMERLMPRDPVCTLRSGTGLAIFDAAIPAVGLPPLPWSHALTAVIEEEGGQKSFWAMAHPGEAPDFHDPACFAATLAAPQAP